MRLILDHCLHSVNIKLLRIWGKLMPDMLFIASVCFKPAEFIPVIQTIDEYKLPPFQT